MVMNGFIYVFSDEGRDILLSRQYELLKSDGFPYALSNTLTF